MGEVISEPEDEEEELYDYPPMLMYDGILYITDSNYHNLKMYLVGETDLSIYGIPEVDNQVNESALVGCEIYKTKTMPGHIFIKYGGNI